MGCVLHTCSPHQRWLMNGGYLTESIVNAGWAGSQRDSTISRLTSWGASCTVTGILQEGHSAAHVSGRRETMLSERCLAPPHPYPGGGSPCCTVFVIPAHLPRALSLPRRSRSGQRR